MAVIGAGWAGCAAAVELARAGHRVTVYEAARVLGGRARRVELDGGALDNGQHILLGAYSETLRLLKLVGIEHKRALLNLPLQMRYPPDSDGMDFVAPRWPAPLHLAAALLRAKGLARADKLALARFSSTARWMGWQLHTDCSVSELLERYDQTERLKQLMWRPLCLAALNTPPERASAQVFLNVLRDSLGAHRSASDMLLPRVDLSALFPDAAAAYVSGRGGAILTGSKAGALQRLENDRWRIDTTAENAGADFDAVVIATPAAAAAQLLEQLQDTTVSGIVAQLGAFTSEAISTCYLQYGPDVRLEQEFYALADVPEAGHWGQFVFDRGQLDAAQAGLLAVVVSASGAAAALPQAQLAAAVAAQLAQVLRRPALAQPLSARVISDKRATFACTPGLARPPNATGLAGLMLAGDYTAGAYPATLESAVRSGVLAAAGLA
ncbi:hydroxysqualene dehydroxylase HpnE [Janthinobacterium sp.]|uniref:hydroxysqualene dehydroxylase HpnE n=1 Tax=Janthinobacterium sp. TaxID=1871054 RepID=UPI00293D4929|nr:hydroxysqualene dehydroxylase HpnE [Janthinobacterium sp.]